MLTAFLINISRKGHVFCQWNGFAVILNLGEKILGMQDFHVRFHEGDRDHEE